MDIVKYCECYNYNAEWYIIEMLLDISARDIDWNEIYVPEEGIDRDSWQVPYMEQYLNESGTEKICETYETPKQSRKPCRVVFYIYKSGD